MKPGDCPDMTILSVSFVVTLSSHGLYYYNYIDLMRIIKIKEDEIGQRCRMKKKIAVNQ